MPDSVALPTGRDRLRSPGDAQAARVSVRSNPRAIAIWLSLKTVLGDSRADRIRVIGLFSFFFLVIAAFWVQKPIRTSQFLTAVGSKNLPWAKLGTALLILPVVLLYSSIVARHRREHMVYFCTAFFAACSLAFWWLFSFSPEHAWVHYAYFFYVDIFNSVLVTLFWSFANDLTSPDQARREYGFIGAGGIIGGAAGSSLTGWTVARIGAPDLLLICIVLLLTIAAVARVIARQGAPTTVTQRPAASIQDAVAGARLTLHSRYLTYIAAIVVLYEIASNLIDYQFNTLVAEHYHDAVAMASFLGQFSAVSIVAAILTQFVITTWVLRRWGPRVGLLILPAVVGLGSVSFLFVPAFSVIAATFFGDATLSYSLNQTSKELLYTPTDEASKYQAKAFIDMFLMRFGKGISAVLLLGWIAVLSPQGWGTNWLGLLSAVIVSIWIGVAWAAARQFSRQTKSPNNVSIHLNKNTSPSDPVAIESVAVARAYV